METKENRETSAIIEVIDHGPLKITGLIILVDPKKDITDSPVELYLCRCGRSCKKPYCDGSHRN